MDPVLQLSLLGSILDVAGKGSYPLALALRPHREYLRNLKLDLTVPWMIPGNASARKVRSDAVPALKGLPSLTEVPKTSAEHRRRLESRLTAPRPLPAGWLSRDRSKGWNCRVGPSLQGQYALSVVYPDPNRGAVWKPVGKLGDGVARIQAVEPGLLLEGRLVFAREVKAPQDPE